MAMLWTTRLVWLLMCFCITALLIMSGFLDIYSSCHPVDDRSFLSLAPINVSAPPLNVSVAIQLTEHSPKLLELFVALRSLLLFRSCPINFHLIAGDAQTEDLIKSWFMRHPRLLDQVQVQFHNSTGFRIKTNFHAFAGTKVLVHEVLPEYIHQVLLIDTDLVFADDVCRSVQSEFAQFNETQLMALAIEWSGWYPAAQHGFRLPEEIKAQLPKSQRHLEGLNSGLILLHLDKMRAFNWTKKIESFGNTERWFGDQDFFNEMAIHYPEILRVLPLTFNWQFPNLACPEIPLDIHSFHGNGGAFQNKVREGLRDFVENIWSLFSEECGFSLSEREKLIHQFFYSDHKSSWCKD